MKIKSFGGRMSPCDERTLELIKLISKTRHPKSLIKKCSKGEIRTLCECVLNVLRGNIPLTRQQKNRLSPHKESLRKLSNKKTPLYKKKKILIQKGEGFLSILLPAAVSLISSLVHGAR